MTRKKLVIVTTVPRTLRAILKDQPAFLSNTFDVHLISSGRKAIRAVAKAEGVAGHVVPMRRGINLLIDLWSLICMIKAIRAIKPDIVHSYTPKAGLISMLAAWLCRVPVRVHTFTGLIFPTSTGLKKKLLIWIDRLICTCATDVLPESAGVLKDLREYRITRKELKLIGHGNIAGVDTKFYSRSAVAEGGAREKFGIDKNSFVFCYVGRLHRDKGIEELAAAFTNLKGNVDLFLVGGLDETAPISGQVLDKIRSHPRIHLCGFVQDIRPFLADSNIFVLPSYREGFPNVVLQAGAMELPSIVTDVSGSNEVITPDFNGWIVEPKSVESLQVVMTDALAAPSELLIKFGNNARCRIAAQFERNIHWERMVAFYNDLVA